MLWEGDTVEDGPVVLLDCYVVAGLELEIRGDVWNISRYDFREKDTVRKVTVYVLARTRERDAVDEVVDLIKFLLSQFRAVHTVIVIMK